MQNFLMLFTPRSIIFQVLRFSLKKIFKLMMSFISPQWYNTDVQIWSKCILLFLIPHGWHSMLSGLSYWHSGCPCQLGSPLKFKGKKLIRTFCKLRGEILLGVICYNDKFIRSCSFYLLQNCSLMALICSNDYRKVIQSCSKGKVTGCFLSLFWMPQILQ